MTKQTIKLPSKVIKEDWHQDIDFESYEDEKSYVSPKRISKETLNKIKNSPIRLTIREMIDWNKIKKQLAV